MFEILKKNVEKIDHHEYEYKDGKKILKEECGIRYAYIDKAGLFHATKWEDDASKYGMGVYAKTDEIGSKGGFPVVKGKVYKVWGADKFAVRLSKDSNERFHVKKEQLGNTVIVPHNDKEKTSALNVIREMYIMLEAAREKAE